MGFLEDFRKKIALCYYRWELATILYMFEFKEKVAFYLLLFSSLGLLFYATITFLPGHLIMWFHFFGYGNMEEGTNIGHSTPMTSTNKLEL